MSTGMAVVVLLVLVILGFFFYQWGYINQYIQISGWFFGLAGLGMAIVANHETVRVKNLARAEAWNLHRSADVACGVTQDSLRLYKQKHIGMLDPEVLERLSKADALTLEVYYNTIRHFQLVEPKFTLTIIGHWVDLGKIIPEHKQDFIKIVVED